jgi:hypothetical protein
MYSEIKFNFLTFILGLGFSCTVFDAAFYAAAQIPLFRRMLGLNLGLLRLWYWQSDALHCNKRLAIFPSPAGMSLTKLALAGYNLIIPDQGEFRM